MIIVVVVVVVEVQLKAAEIQVRSVGNNSGNDT